jgi:hypothetical protein
MKMFSFKQGELQWLVHKLYINFTIQSMFPIQRVDKTGFENCAVWTMAVSWMAGVHIPVKA